MSILPQQPDPNRRRHAGGGNGRPLWPWLLGGAIALAVLVGALLHAFPETAKDGFSQVNLIWGVTLLVALGGSLIVRVRARPGQALRQAAAWIAIAAVLLLGYSYRHEFGMVKDRMLAELLPDRAVPGDGSVSIGMRTDGHFAVEATVNGTPIRFLIDTGASEVVLSPSDARKLGFDVDGLKFTQPFSTANGVVWGAPITLNRIAIGPVALNDVSASVNGAAMGQSLLGMSFLGRLSGYAVENGRMTLRQ